MNTVLKPGIIYTVETIKNGVVVDTETIHNLMPYEGMNHLLNTELKGGSQVSSWYIGIYENNYAPVLADTMATFPGGGVAAESTAYTESTREALTLGTVTNGVVDNTASKAEFTMNATKTIYGGFVSSASAKSSTSGTLLSAVKFGTAKSCDATTILRVTASFTLASS